MSSINNGIFPYNLSGDLATDLFAALSKFKKIQPENKLLLTPDKKFEVSGNWFQGISRTVYSYTGQYNPKFDKVIDRLEYIDKIAAYLVRNEKIGKEDLTQGREGLLRLADTYRKLGRTDAAEKISKIFKEICEPKTCSNPSDSLSRFEKTRKEIPAEQTISQKVNEAQTQNGSQAAKVYKTPKAADEDGYFSFDEEDEENMEKDLSV